MSCGSTSSVTSPRRAGFSKALSTPTASVRPHTTGTLAKPARSSRPSTARLQRQAGVERDRQRAPVPAVGDGARPGAEHEHRQELQGDGDPEVGGPSRQVVDQQRHRRDLQPRADRRHEHPGEEDTGVAMAQAPERRRRPRARRPCDRSARRAVAAQSQSSRRRAEMNTSPGTSTRPIDFIFFLPSFCFSSSLRLRVMSPP